MELPDFVSTEQLAEYLGVPVSSVRKWRTMGTGPRGHRLGKVVRYSRIEIERWLASRLSDTQSA